MLKTRYWSEGFYKGTRLHKVAKGQYRQHGSGIYQAGLISQLESTTQLKVIHMLKTELKYVLV